MANAWISQDYLADGYTAPGYVTKQPQVVAPGAYLNKRYADPKYTGQEWFAYDLIASGPTPVTVLNVPAVDVTNLSGSAKLALRVNANTQAVPVAVFDTLANAGTNVTQLLTNTVPVATFDTFINAGFTQIGDISFTIEVDSTFGFSHNVFATLSSVSVTTTDAIVGFEGDTNVAATLSNVPVFVYQADSAAKTSALAGTVNVPINVLDAQVSVGTDVQVDAPSHVPVTPIPVAVGSTVLVDTNVSATLSHVPVTVLDALAGGIFIGGTLLVNEVRFEHQMTAAIRFETQIDGSPSLVNQTDAIIKVN